MRKPRRLVVILCLVLALVLPLFLYEAYVRWDMHRLRTLCDELHPGTPVPHIRTVVARYGLDRVVVVSTEVVGP
jgi:hypothetical protein